MPPRKRAFEIAYRPETIHHLNAIKLKYLSLIRNTIEDQLSHEPFKETTNRKPLLRDSPLGDNVWELRFGPKNQFRVFYCPDAEAPRRLFVEAIGVKIRDQLKIGGQEVKL